MNKEMYAEVSKKKRAIKNLETEICIFIIVSLAPSRVPGQEIIELINI